MPREYEKLTEITISDLRKHVHVAQYWIFIQGALHTEVTTQRRKESTKIFETTIIIAAICIAFHRDLLVRVEWQRGTDAVFKPQREHFLAYSQCNILHDPRQLRIRHPVKSSWRNAPVEALIGLIFIYFYPKMNTIRSQYCAEMLVVDARR